MTQLNVYNQNYVNSTYKITETSQYVTYSAFICHSMLYLQTRPYFGTEKQNICSNYITSGPPFHMSS